jgi:hypothetical protein
MTSRGCTPPLIRNPSDLGLGEAEGSCISSRGESALGSMKGGGGVREGRGLVSVREGGILSSTVC